MGKRRKTLSSHDQTKKRKSLSSHDQTKRRKSHDQTKSLTKRKSLSSHDQTKKKNPSSHDKTKKITRTKSVPCFRFGRSGILWIVLQTRRGREGKEFLRPPGIVPVLRK